MISPFETPLLDAIGDAEREATNVLHEWHEDALNPNTVTGSSAIASTTADTQLGIVGGEAAAFNVGDILRAQVAGNEYVQVVSVSGNTLTVSRAFGGTLANSLAAGAKYDVISTAAQEGADVDRDTSRVRPRKSNIMQIFKKDVIVSGSQQAVILHAVDDEFDYQRTERLRELIRDLEKATLMSILSGNSIGSSTKVRTTSGTRQIITTNVQSIGTLTESWFGNTVKLGWDQGGTDLDIACFESTGKRVVDGFQGSKAQVIQGQGDNVFRNWIDTYTSTYGTQRVLLSRWMPVNEFQVLSSRRLKVVPLRTRSFQFIETARTGDSRKGFIVGEYCVELKNQEGMSRGIFT